MENKLLIVGLLVMVFSGTVIAAEGLGKLQGIFWDIACVVYQLLLPAAFLAMIAAAVIYAFGQVGHAEMRAKAQSWAMWALVAGIVAIIIVLVLPTILYALFPTPTTGDTFPQCCIGTTISGDSSGAGASCYSST